ncbi:MAG TPA: tetratricopeptide repeat protein [Bacteroidales bacterium]|nr:tetratricopeptide repeat protein [Bacteroidales bacterium]
MNNNSKKRSTKIRNIRLFSIGIVIIIGLIIYSNSFKCSFHFDDYDHIVNNPKIHDLNDFESWWNYSTNRPVSIFTFVVNYHYHELNVFYYHLVNLLIHLINAILVWWFTLLLFSTPIIKKNLLYEHKRLIALIVSLLFVSHPLATQSVTYIIQRQSSLAALFYFLSLALYLQARISDKSVKFKVVLFLGAFFSAVLAFYSKENAYTLPFTIILLELFCLNTKSISFNFKNYRLIVFVVAFISIVGIILFKFSFDIFNPIDPSRSVGTTIIITPLNYLMTQFSVILKYIQLLFFPVGQNLDYDFPITQNFFSLSTIFSFLILTSIFVLAIYYYKKNRIISFGIFWFFLCLSIESSFIPIDDVIFEHRTYLPSYGFFLVFVISVFSILKLKNKNIAISIFVIIVLINSILTYQRNKVWLDDITLWTDVINKSPNKARPYGNRGIAYDNLGNWELALQDYNKAIEINPDYAIAYSNRGLIFGKLGDYDNAISDFSEALRVNPNYVLARWNRGVTYSILQKWEEAIEDYNVVIEIDTSFVDAYYNMGVAYSNLGEWEMALNNFNSTIQLNPEYPNAFLNRGVSFDNLGVLEKALSDYSIAIQKDPNNAVVYFYRAVVYDSLKQYEQSISDYSKAIELNPNLSEAYLNRENVLRKLK